MQCNFGEIKNATHKQWIRNVLDHYIQRYGTDWTGNLPSRYNVSETLYWHTRKDEPGTYGTSVEIKISTDGRVTVR